MYHKNELHAITSRLRGHLPIFDNKILDVHLGEKGGQKGKNFMNFILASKFTYFYFHATWALLDDFEIFDHFYIFYLTFLHFRPENNGVGKFFRLHKLKTKNFGFSTFNES